jgi:hypothetical protein
MKRLGGLLGVLALAFAAAGCASGHSAPHPHYYSVRRVEAVFAAHGVKLRRAVKQDLLGFVVLRSDKVAVAVRVTRQPRAFPTADFSRASVHLVRHGNLLVALRMARTAPINAALGDLH